jgi:hypothetical protein
VRLGLNPGPHTESEPLPAYADLQTDGVNCPDVDWYEFDRIAEQTLGGSRSA